MGDSWTKADKVCTRWERRFVVLTFCTCYIGIASKLESNEARLIAAVIGVFSGVLCACWYNILSVHSAVSLLPWCSHCVHIDCDMEVLLTDSENAPVQSVLEFVDDRASQPTPVAGLLDSGAPPGTTQAAVCDPSEVLQETSQTVYGSGKIVYSVLTARSYYYEVVK